MVVAHLLGLLVTFIGEPLTLRLVRDAWPDASVGPERTREVWRGNHERGRPGDDPEAADRGAGPGRDPGRRAARVLVQHHRRRPGGGKTTLAHQVVFANATPERPALYFTVLGEPALKMLRYQQQFRFFDPAKLNTAVRFVNLSQVVLEKDLDAVLEEIVKEVEAASPGVVVVDSFRTVVRKAGGGTGEVELQAFVQRLALHLTSWQATTFLIGEYTEGEIRDNPVFTVADGLVLAVPAGRAELDRAEAAGHEAARPGVRPGPAHVPHHRGRGAGLPPHLRPHRTGGEGRPTGGGSRAGIAELDAMLGGGIPEGDSLLVAGPSGTGKSVLRDPVHRRGPPPRGAGDRGHVRGAAARSTRGGPPPSAWISTTPQRDGKLSIIYLRPLDLSVDETMREILDAVERTGAKRLVIDSLAGFEMALAPGFRADFRESLYRMIGALTRTGRHDREHRRGDENFTELALSPYSISFLSDDIIRLRYVEIDGQLRKVLMVVKMRGGRPQQGHPRVRDHVRGLADRRPPDGLSRPHHRGPRAARPWGPGRRRRPGRRAGKGDRGESWVRNANSTPRRRIRPICRGSAGTCPSGRPSRWSPSRGRRTS